MTAPDDWIRTALTVTGHFEDTANPLAAVTPDFDGMGVSLGVLQWNFGSGSLQPLALAAGEEAIRAAMSTIGADFVRACHLPIPQSLALVRTWQPNGVLTAVARAELRAFTGGAAFVAEQIKAAGRVAATAFDAATRWAAPARPASKREFVWFFDLFTQNGGLKGLGRGDVDDFVASQGSAVADDTICDVLARAAPGLAGFRDAHRNGDLWRNQVAADRLPLFVLSHLRAQLSRPEFRVDTLNRKATLAVGTGFVHGEKHDIDALVA